ncbi:hypothetical protein [Nocardioides sp. L-11A]|uniref:hypothetical protein n=1 Tax=Nocardioides sp. L-11A TaxID=3043848 RepID=UPI00249A0CFB|nr:hypothetical protein QJ852_25975 [Nocardioides sp. L-11A]
MNLLHLYVDTAVPSRPTVRILVDGAETLAAFGDATNTVEDILLSGALLPQDPPRRIAFYGCGCGELGCANVAGLVRRRGGVIEWADFRTVTGAYRGALPIEDVPDPADDPETPSRALDLPTLTFEATAYLSVVRAATGVARLPGARPGGLG